MDRESKPGLTEALMKVNGSEEFKKGKESKPGLKQIQNIKENGKMV